MVKWAVATVEWIYYDTEHFNNKDKVNGAYPYKAGKKHPTIYYCYYRGEKTNLLLALNPASHVCIYFIFFNSVNLLLKRS